MKIGKAIKDLRKEKGIKQGEFAQTIGISGTSLSLIESDTTTPKKTILEKICKNLDISVEVLYLLSVREEDIPEKNKERYKEMFPKVHEMMIQIFSEDDSLVDK